MDELDKFVIEFRNRLRSKPAKEVKKQIEEIGKRKYNAPSWRSYVESLDSSLDVIENYNEYRVQKEGLVSKYHSIEFAPLIAAGPKEEYRSEQLNSLFEVKMKDLTLDDSISKDAIINCANSIFWGEFVEIEKPNIEFTSFEFNSDVLEFENITNAWTGEIFVDSKFQFNFYDSSKIDDSGKKGDSNSDNRKFAMAA